ncbi:MAG: hypothetical protein ACRERE_13355 [Candidatus Entotheonellia bacterium]
MRPWRPIQVMIVCFVPWLAWADGVGDAILRLPVVRDNIAGTQTIDSPIYSARLVATIDNIVGPNNDFNNGDTITFTLTGKNGRTLTPSPFIGTRDRFDQFVRDNAKEIIEILFPSGIATQVNGLDDSQALALLTFDTLVAPNAPVNRMGLVGLLPALRELSVQFDFDRFKVDGTRGTNYSFTPVYNPPPIGPLGVTIALQGKFSNLKDVIDTSSYNAGMNFGSSYLVAGGRDWAIDALGGAFLNALTFSSDVIDVGGYLRYGGFVGGRGMVVLGPVFLTGGATYTASALSIPNALIPDDIREIGDAIEDRPLDQQVVFGANIILPLHFLPKSIHRRLAQRGARMIHRIWPHIRVSSRQPRHAQEYCPRPSAGGASCDAGRAAARAIWLLAGPPHLVVVCGWT